MVIRLRCRPLRSLCHGFIALDESQCLEVQTTQTQCIQITAFVQHSPDPADHVIQRE